MCRLRSGKCTGADAPGCLFTPFPKLPLEIREKIWVMAIDARVFYFIGGQNGVVGPRASLLSTCYESRSAALKHYTIDSFTTPGRISLWAHSTVPVQHQQCFNFAKDIFVLDSNSPQRDLPFFLYSAPFVFIKNLVISPEFWREVLQNKVFYWSALGFYRAVQRAYPLGLNVFFAVDEKRFTDESSMEVIKKLRRDLIEYGRASESEVGEFKKRLQI